MTIILRRANGGWLHDDERIRDGETYQLGGDRWFILRQSLTENHKVRTSLFMPCGENKPLKHNISDDSIIVITEHGAAAVQKDNPRDTILASEILERFARRGMTALLGLSFLPTSETIDGTSFRVRVSSKGTNTFSDADIAYLRREGDRKRMMCKGGTFLVRGSRHVNGYFFRVDVTVQTHFNRDALYRTLDKIA